MGWDSMATTSMLVRLWLDVVDLIKFKHEVGNHRQLGCGESCE